MKTTIKAFLLIPFIVGLYSCNQQRPAVIERPVFDVWSSTILEIDKIEMSDSATVFHFDAYLQPNRPIKIDKGAYIRESGSNEKLLVIRAEGINLDEATNMPESGTISFKLFFPPLKQGITKIDFIENNYKIWGIYLLPNAKIKFDPVPKDALKTTNEPLPTPEYTAEPAKISGRMLGYTKGMELSNVAISTFNIPIIRRIDAAFPIAEDGSFSGEFTPFLAGIYNTSLGPIFLVPGEEAKIYVDLKKRSRYQSRYRTDKEPSDSIHTYLSGRFTSADLETINQTSEYFSTRIRRLPEYQMLLKEVVDMNPEEIKQYMLGIMSKKLDEIKQKNYSANMQTMMEIAVKTDVFFCIMNEYVGWMYNAYLQANNITITSQEEYDKVMTIYKQPENPGAEYYSFLKGELNDDMSYIPKWFGGFAEELNYNYFFNLGNRRNYSAKELFDYFEEKWNLVMGDYKGLLYNIVQTMRYGWKLRDMEYFTDAEKQEISEAFSYKPVYVETLIAESDRMELIVTATKEGNESIKNATPDVPQEQMLDAILAKYRGKVVVADIWGTWCPSCIQAIRNIPPLKDEMKDKDVVFLYLADETSPLDTWEKTIPAISGEHYRVSGAQARYWEVNVYPSYMVYDKQGKQIARFNGFPGFDVIKKEIEKGL